MSITFERHTVTQYLSRVKFGIIQEEVLSNIVQDNIDQALGPVG